MVETRRVEEADLGEICGFLEQHMHRGMSAEEYRKLFTYPWMASKPGKGFVLVEGGKIVGFLGGIYADRQIDGRIERFCNLTNWCVLPEYRGNSLSLLFAMAGDPSQTVVNLSPSPEVEKMLHALRYEVLDSYKLFSFPLAHVHTLIRFPKPLTTTNPNAIRDRLDDSDRKIFLDHQGTGCGHLLMGLPERYCYAVWKKRKKKRVTFSEVLYIREPEVFLRHFELAKARILFKDRTLLMAVDQRLLGRRPIFVLPYRRPSMFRSRSVMREQIDNLYSEIAIL